MGKVKNMTKGNPTALLVSFALPLMAANLGQQLYMIIDAMIVGKGVGIEALASVGATDWAYWMALWVIQAFTQGFAIPISQFFGEGNWQRIRKSTAMAIKMCGIIGIVMTVVCVLMAQPILRILRTPEYIFAGAVHYLMMMYAGILIVMAYNLASAVLRALGDGKTPMLAIFIAALTNIFLDLLFVLVFRWGIIGAAAATLLAQFLAFVYCFYVLKKLEFMKIRKEDWQSQKEIMRLQCKMGFPFALQHVLVAVGGMILQSAINRQGVAFVAGFTAANKVFGLLESSAISIGHAVTTYMAQNYGGGFYLRIRKGLKSAVLFSVLLAGAIAVCMILSGRMILGLFIDNTNGNAGKALEIGYHYLYVVSCYLCPLYLLYVFRNTLQGIGRSFASFLAGVMEFAGRVLAATVFLKVFGTEIIFYADPMAWIAAMVVLTIICIDTIRQLNT